MTKFIIILFSTLGIVLFSCEESTPQKQKITIVAAASSQFAVEELAKEFCKENDVKIDVIAGASGKITTQIMNGAPYDIFFSANMNYPQALFEDGKAVAAPKNYGFGVPILWTYDNTLELDSAGKFLLGNTIGKIAIANPKSAPYGEMAVQFFKNNGIYDSIESQLVYGESISLVNEYILNKTVSVGISAKSIVLSPNIIEKGTYLTLGKNYWIAQGVVELTNTAPSEVKTKFMAFIFSEKGQNLFKKYGYEL